MILEPSADFLVTPGSPNGKFLRDRRLDLDVEIHGQRRSVEGGAKVRRRRGQRDPKTPQLLVLGPRWHEDQDSPACSRVRITASSVASSATGGCRNGCNEEAAPSSRVPLNKSPRWKSMVKSGSFSRFPVKTRTTVSLGFTNPCFTSFLSPASVTADAGSHPIPSAPISALACASSTSVTCSHAPRRKS